MMPLSHVGPSRSRQTTKAGSSAGRTGAALQLFRIDDNINAHLACGRGSALAALTADDDEIDSTLTYAHRYARDASFNASHEKLNAAAEAAYEYAVALGIPPGPRFRPGLDARAMSGAASLALHQERVPMTYSGLGTKRLFALAIQARQNLWEFSLSSSMRSSMGLNRFDCCISCIRYVTRSRRLKGRPVWAK